ncbi:uncharacterized protein LOC110676129 [Aedes aegypti]|uniref:Uncharacterized protein n=1 Tax=Aedes aegypti TaxID=7159 RepID=A0A6I8U5Z2_AEDAE|nr:uncharacterized protein LOC110676129 [Aedes aegypti]
MRLPTLAQERDLKEQKHLRRLKQLIMILVMDSLEQTPTQTLSTKTMEDTISLVPMRMPMRSAKDLALMDSAAAQQMHKLSHSKVAVRLGHLGHLQPMPHRKGSLLDQMASPDRHLSVAVKRIICQATETYRYRTRKEFQLGRMDCRHIPGDMHEHLNI